MCDTMLSLSCVRNVVNCSASVCPRPTLLSSNRQETGANTCSTRTSAQRSESCVDLDHRAKEEVWKRPTEGRHPA
eukprot:2303531-Pyramimonas_sp.AAC.1